MDLKGSALDLLRLASDRDRYAVASQLAVLRSCPGVISRLLRSTASLLLAAKVLVMSRLLHTKISQRSSPPLYLENLRIRLANLRRRLLAKVDRIMKRTESSDELLGEAMCAFALATSSSPTDVLRHYHHVRLEAIEETQRKSGQDLNILQSLKIYVNTLRDTSLAVPGSLAQALERLKAVPILRSPEIRALTDLNLDLHERNLSDGIRMFTPYIRLDGLQKAESERLLKHWGKQAFSSFLANLRANANNIPDAHKLLNLRNATLELWYSNQQYAVGMDSSEIVDDLRDVFNSRWSSIIHEQVASLDSVSVEVEAILQSWPGRNSNISPMLWAPAMLSIETTNGAKSFRETLTTSLQGRNEPVRSVTERYKTWVQGIEEIEETIKELSTVKWEDDLDGIDDEDDLLNNKQILLNEDDPRMLRDKLSGYLQSGFSQLQETMQKATNNLSDQGHGQKAVFLLRVWREIRQHLPNSYENAVLGLDSVMALQQLVAKAVCRNPLARGRIPMEKTYQSITVAGKALWEGDPPLPVLPSPWVFHLLRELSSVLGEIGTDVWSPQSITILKGHLRSSLALMFKSIAQPAPYMNGHSDATNDAEKLEKKPPLPEETEEGLEGSKNELQANGDVSTDEAPKSFPDGISQDVRVQRFFDVLYLENATRHIKQGAMAEAEGPLALQASVDEDIDLSVESRQRLRKGADEYWKRTSLLFALLA